MPSHHLVMIQSLCDLRGLFLSHIILSLKRWFSNFSVHHLDGLLKQSGTILRICIINKFPGDAAAAGWNHILRTTGLRASSKDHAQNQWSPLPYFPALSHRFLAHLCSVLIVVSSFISLPHKTVNFLMAGATFYPRLYPWVPSTGHLSSHLRNVCGIKSEEWSDKYAYYINDAHDNISRFLRFVYWW